MICLLTFVFINFLLQNFIAALESQCINIRGIGEAIEILVRNSFSYSASEHAKSRETNSASIVLLARIVYFDDCQDITLPPNRKTKPDVDLTSNVSEI